MSKFLAVENIIILLSIFGPESNRRKSSPVEVTFSSSGTTMVATS